MRLERSVRSREIGPEVRKVRSEELGVSFLYNSKYREPGKVVEKQKYLSLE